jgi:hypothetical protein
VAILAGGVVGAVLITRYAAGVVLPVVMVALPLVALLVAGAARRTGFPAGR